MYVRMFVYEYLYHKSIYSLSVEQKNLYFYRASMLKSSTESLILSYRNNGNKKSLHSISIRGWNKNFLFDRSFLLLTKSHCSSPIATESFGSAVNPLFDPAFTHFPHFSFKEVPELKKINLFTLILFNIFLSENTIIHCYLIPNTLEIQSRTRFTFFIKPTFQEVTQCHCTKTLYKI